MRLQPSLLFFAFTLSACAPAAPLPTPTPPPSSSPSPLDPIATASPNPGNTPSPSAQPAEPTPVPTAEASPSPSPLPTVDTELDVSIIEPTTFNGRVYDENNSLLDGVTVSVRSLSASTPFTSESQTLNGSYAVNNAPAGVQLEITASKPGYASRRRVEVLKSNKQGAPDVNRYDFGTDTTSNSTGTFLNALNNLPEVVSVSPERNASNVSPSTRFILTFSEPMNTQSVENAFIIRSFNERQLSVDSGSSSPTFTGNSQIGTWNGSQADMLIKNAAIGTPVWDKNAFSISWNANQTQATFEFTAERALPTDTAANRVPDYRISFGGISGNFISDKEGNSRNHHHFKSLNGPFEDSYRFAIQNDDQAPGIIGITALTNSTQGDALQLRFDKRLLLDTLNRAIAGGMDNSATSAQRAAAAYPEGNGPGSNAQDVAENYTLQIFAAHQDGQLKHQGSWRELGGSAHYDTGDVRYKTVILRAPQAQNLTLGTVLNTETLTANIVFTDQSTTAVTFTAPADINTLAELQSALNNNANWNTDIWSEAPFQLSGTLQNAQLTLGDPVTLQQGAGDARRVASLTFTGGTATIAPGLNNQRRIAGAQVTQDGYWQFYRSGDQVQITVRTSVLDPSGNSLRNNIASTIAN